MTTINISFFIQQTYIANVLIAINPYKVINTLYSQERIEMYRVDLNDELPPHLYAIG